MELREKELAENGSKNISERVTRRYMRGEDGRVQRSWNGKLPEEFSEKDTLSFLVDTDIRLNGKISKDTLASLDQAGYTYQNGTIQRKSMQDPVKEAAEFVQEYAAKIEKQAEDNKNFLIEDNSIFPFEISDGSHAALRYAYIGKSEGFKDIRDAESGIKMNIVAAIYRDGTLNEYDQGIEERKFTLKGVDAINDFCGRLDRSVKDGIKAHPDIQPVVTVNYSEYDNYNPLVGDHMRLSLDRANSLFELIDIVAGREVKEKGSKVYYKTSADVMFVQNGKVGHFDLRQDFGKNSGSIIKQIEGYIDNQIKYLDKHPELPDGKNQLQQWETAKKELIPYFDRHISLSRAERDLEYMGKAAAVMQDNIFEMRAFLNTGTIVPVPEKHQPVQTQGEQESDFSRQIDDMLGGRANRYDDIKVCATPDLMVQAGCVQLPMFISQSHIRNILHPKDKRNPHWHGLTVQQLKKVPELISDPVMIFDSANRRDSIVVALGETDTEKLPLIISLRPQGKGKYELSEVESNFITSIYGKDNFSNFVEKVIQEDRMIYCSKQKSQELFSVLGLQLPQGFNNLDFDKIIHLSKNIVKNEVTLGSTPENAAGITVEKHISAKEEGLSKDLTENDSMNIPEMKDTLASMEQPEDQSQPIKGPAKNDKLQETMERLEKGIKELFDSERYKNYLNVMSKFHNYSVNNTILIAMQRPDATRVAGYNDWKNKFNRQVQKGEKGITIIQPVPYQVKRQVEKVDPQTKEVVIGADGKPVTEEVDVTIMKYKTGNVFDISQTDGPELPTIGVTELTGNVKEYPLFLRAVEQVSPVPVNFEQIPGSSKGFYHQVDKRIVVKEGMGELQSIKTLIHEIAHSKLHDRDLQEENDIDTRTKEVQAESIAYTVCQHFGLDTSDYSFAYLTSWSSGRELPELKASLETISSTASGLINDIERNFAELTKDKEQEQEAPAEATPGEKQTEQETAESAKEEMRPEQSEKENRPDRVYLELPIVKKEEFAILLQELKQHGAKFDGEQKQWYIDKESVDSGIFNAYIRTYLAIPSMNKEKFASTVQQLRQDGAHFDKIHKKWYIDANCDKGKFQAYLSQKPKERLSVLGKLQQTKKTISDHNAADQTKNAGQRRQAEKEAGYGRE